MTTLNKDKDMYDPLGEQQNENICDDCDKEHEECTCVVMCKSCNKPLLDQKDAKEFGWKHCTPCLLSQRRKFYVRLPED